MSRVASTNVFEALSKPKSKPSSKDDEPGPAPPPRKGGLSTASSRLNVGDWADSDDDGGFHAAPSWADEVRVWGGASGDVGAPNASGVGRNGRGWPGAAAGQLLLLRRARPPERERVLFPSAARSFFSLSFSSRSQCPFPTPHTH
jgi:hypothetical protein